VSERVKARDKRGEIGSKNTETEYLTTGERLSLEIARLFPESFRLWGNRVSVNETTGTETTRAKVSADLASMYSAANAERKAKQNKPKKQNKGSK